MERRLVEAQAAMKKDRERLEDSLRVRAVTSL